MLSVHNPARSRPLSRNVKRLMRMSREDPQNPNVAVILKKAEARDLAYCDMQGNIFMAAIDRGLSVSDFAPVYMNSQLAGVIDHSFSCAGGMENDDLSQVLQMPMLLKSPEVIVDVVVWLDKIVSMLEPTESAGQAVLDACMGDISLKSEEEHTPQKNMSLEELTNEYEYAYWLGYIYRCECLLHDESSRMVYGAFSEDFMRRTYNEMFAQDSVMNDATLSDCAAEICRRLDMLLIGKLWK